MTEKTEMREALIETFFREISRMSTWTVMFHGAVAMRLGLNPTDLKCGGVLRETGPITAGELATLTGLTTGAITGVIDRLEKGGFVRRALDPTDRRRVIIEPIEDEAQAEAMMELFGPLAESTRTELIDHYSDEELTLLIDFIARGGTLMKAQTARLHQDK
jgi:DNA-binding MarR family transcriptional regulator